MKIRFAYSPMIKDKIIATNNIIIIADLCCYVHAARQYIHKVQRQYSEYPGNIIHHMLICVIVPYRNYFVLYIRPQVL